MPSNSPIPLDAWHRVERWLLAARDVPAAERDAFLRRACPDALRPLVLDLLARLADAPPLADVLLSGETVNALSQIPPSIEDTTLPVSRVGTYQLVRHIGAGGMGSVYLGQSIPRPDAPLVAIKLLRRDLYGDEIDRRFRRERMILATLQHDGIAAFLDAGSTREGWPYYAMEYIEGTHLLAYCAQRRLTASARLGLIEATCVPVAYAHAQRVIHCDLKPTNVFVTYSEGAVKILDFGIAKVLRPQVQPDGSLADDSFLFLTQPCSNAHTPTYAAPEQKAGALLGPEADVYALGVLARHLLSEAADCETCPEAAACAPVWRRACSPDPAARYSDASSLLAAIRAARGSTSGLQSPKSQLPGASGSSLR